MKFMIAGHTNSYHTHTLDEALEGITAVCATAMTPRDFGPQTHAPRDLLPSLVTQGHSVGFLFGSERFGMRNDDVYRCHHCISIPTHPDYGSLNLAQAVQLVAYEWRQAVVEFLDPAVPRKLMPRLNQLMNQQQLTREELHILHGIARAVLRKTA